MGGKPLAIRWLGGGGMLPPLWPILALSLAHTDPEYLILDVLNKTVAHFNPIYLVSAHYSSPHHVFSSWFLIR